MDEPTIATRREALRWRSAIAGMRESGNSRFWKFRRRSPTRLAWNWIDSGDHLLTGRTEVNEASMITVG